MTVWKARIYSAICLRLISARDIKRQLMDWRHLEGLDDRSLEDIGISRGHEGGKPSNFMWNLR